ncbi:MAG: hypothetical protein ACXWLJ_10420, partial [Rhizomicrobium sp.]
ANHTVKLTQAATANSVDAVVQAFDAALAQAITEITQWALAMPPPTATDAAKAAADPEPATPAPQKGARNRSPAPSPRAP